MKTDLRELLKELKEMPGFDESKTLQAAYNVVRMSIPRNAGIATRHMGKTFDDWRYVCPCCGTGLIPDKNPERCDCGQRVNYPTFSAWRPGFVATHYWDERKQSWLKKSDKKIAV